MTLFGWKLVRKQELRLEREKLDVEKVALAQEIVRLRLYIDKAEKLIDKERARADSERERADRQLDGLLQQNGLPPVTQVVRAEISASEAAAKSADLTRMAQLAEIGRDAMDSIYTEDGLELPPALAKAAASILKDVN